MKSFIKTAGPVLGLALVFTLVAQFSGRVQADPPRPADAVVLHAQQFGDNNDPVGYQYTGIFVDCSSSSRNAPKFTQFQYNAGRQLTSIGDALSELMSQGYVLVHVEGNTYTLTRTPSNK